MVKDVGIEPGKRPPRYLKQNGHETKAEDQEPNGTEEGDEWEQIGSQRQTKFQLLHCLKSDEDLLLTHLSNRIA